MALSGASRSRQLLGLVAFGGAVEGTHCDRAPASCLASWRGHCPFSRRGLGRAVPCLGSHSRGWGGEVCRAYGIVASRGLPSVLVTKRSQWPEVSSKERQLRGVLHGGPGATDPRSPLGTCVQGALSPGGACWASGTRMGALRPRWEGSRGLGEVGTRTQAHSRGWAECAPPLHPRPPGIRDDRGSGIRGLAWGRGAGGRVWAAAAPRLPSPRL